MVTMDNNYEKKLNDTVSPVSKQEDATSIKTVQINGHKIGCRLVWIILSKSKPHVHNTYFPRSHWKSFLTMRIQVTCLFDSLMLFEDPLLNLFSAFKGSTPFSNFSEEEISEVFSSESLESSVCKSVDLWAFWPFSWATSSCYIY